MLKRLGGASPAFLVVTLTVAVCLAVRLIELLAAALIIVAAATGGVLLIGWAIKVIRRRRDLNRW